MEGRQERVEPLDRAHDLSSLSSEVEAVARVIAQCNSAGWRSLGGDARDGWRWRLVPGVNVQRA
jgi:hypothetical protein